MDLYDRFHVDPDIIKFSNKFIGIKSVCKQFVYLEESKQNVVVANYVQPLLLIIKTGILPNSMNYVIKCVIIPHVALLKIEYCTIYCNHITTTLKICQYHQFSIYTMNTHQVHTSRIPLLWIYYLATKRL